MRIPGYSLEIFFATFAFGSSPHSWQAASASGTSIGVEGAEVAAKTLALSGAQLFLSPDKLRDAKAELQRSQGADFQYVPLIGNHKPPLDYARSALLGHRAAKK